MSEGDTRYHVVRAGPKGGWSLMFTREGITSLYEDAKDLKEVAVDSLQDLHAKVSGGGWAICHACADPWPCKTADILAATTREQTR